MARPLFGGALSAVIPPNAQDISDLRQIPDNQEVFGNSQTDQSIIIELLEYQSQVQDADAARYHFEDVAASNKAADSGSWEIKGVEQLPQSELSLQECSSAWLLSGVQLVSKFNEESPQQQCNWKCSCCTVDTTRFPQCPAVLLSSQPWSVWIDDSLIHLKT
ncbi:ran guanine nucleotide release factor isoform X2 [Xyrauchen texanus]|uniref:ran guanine nucleotide release factor isoform X2 n=1 Tax=Xyrauchen texanus TaxID=154827 RepID=UPI00224273A4|nr:ran guanine nucleotide release factor isoform X2 [Xyrauchen texanus]